MLQRFTYAIKSEMKISCQMSSLFHGALMERLSDECATNLHEQQLHPFAQHLEKKGDDWFWVINSLDDATAEAVIRALDGVHELELKKRDARISLTPFSQERMTEDELREIFYRGKDGRYITIRFITPTSFKRSGEYLIFPDLFCIYQSLMNKQDALNSEGYFDLETLEELTQNSKITRYKLSSTVFSLEGVRIPSFIGSVTIRMDSTATMRRFVNMLFAFGEYAGVGIKTSLGMGAITIEENNMRRKSE